MTKACIEKTAPITGATGLDGARLVELLLDEGYIVSRPQRRLFSFDIGHIEILYGGPHKQGIGPELYCSDLTDATNLTRILPQAQSYGIYEHVAQSRVRASDKTALHSGDVDGLRTLRRREATRRLGWIANTRICRASTLELFGERFIEMAPQDLKRSQTEDRREASGALNAMG